MGGQITRNPKTELEPEKSEPEKSEHSFGFQPTPPDRRAAPTAPFGTTEQPCKPSPPKASPASLSASRPRLPHVVLCWKFGWVG